ncbi:MAG: DUF1145 domain-containing protein [Pseudomonadota bacterium]
MTNTLVKAILSVLWVLIILNLFVVLPASLSWFLNGLAIFLIVAHCIEYVVFKEKIDAKGDSLFKSLVMTLAYGLAYIKGR